MKIFPFFENMPPSGDNTLDHPPALSYEFPGRHPGMWSPGPARELERRVTGVVLTGVSGAVPKAPLFFLALDLQKFQDCGTITLMLTKRVKSRVITEHRMHGKDTGSAQVQIGVLSRRVEELAAHLKKNPKDHHSRRGLLKMVSKRRKLLSYLKKNEPKEYEKIAKKLDLK